MVLPSSDRWQQCVSEAPLHAYSVDGTTTLIGRCARERSVLLQSPSMVSCRRKAISLSVRQRKRYEHTLKHIYVGPTIIIYTVIPSFANQHILSLTQTLPTFRSYLIPTAYSAVPYPSADLLHCKHHCCNLATAHSSAGYVDLS